MNNTNIYLFQKFTNILIFYNLEQLVELNAQNEKVYSISIFGTIKFLEINLKNIYTSLLYIANFIKNRKTDNNKLNNLNNSKILAR